MAASHLRLHRVGRKAGDLIGFDLSGHEFWQWAGPKHALTDSVLGDTASLTTIGMIFGAMAAAALAGPFARGPWPPAKSLLSAGIGGLLMGWGRAARLRLQHRRFRRRRCVRLAARLDLVCRGACRLHDRHQVEAVVRPVAGVNVMRYVYAFVTSPPRRVWRDFC